MGYGANQTSAGSVGNALNTAPQQPRLHALGERFERSLAEFQNLNTQLRSVAERTLGAIPENVSKDSPSPGPSTVSHLESHQSALDGMLSTLRHTIERLDSL